MAEGARQQKSLSRLQNSSYVETTIGNVDAAGQKRLQDTIQKTAEVEYVAELERQKHEATLKGVKVDAADIAMIAAQFGLSKSTAERKLRECDGNARRAISELMGL